MSQKQDYLAKVVIIGDSAVGKTNILMRFTSQQYKISHIPTIGVDFKAKTVTIDNKKMKLQLWDTAGQQRFRTITETYYNGASGVVVVYSISDRKSFSNVKQWMQQIQEHNSQNIPKIILANKCDLGTTKQRVVSPQQGRVLAQKFNCHFMEVSAKADINVNQSFILLAKEIKKQADYQQAHPDQKRPGRPDVIINPKKKGYQNKQCCK